MNKNTFKFVICILMLLVTILSPAAADPIMTRTLSDTMVSPGETVHVTLELTNYVNEESLNALVEDYSATEMADWTVSNVECPPELDTHQNSNGIHYFSRNFMSGALPASDYTVKYDLNVGAGTVVGVYDLAGRYLDSSNSAGYNGVGDTQLTVIAASSSLTKTTGIPDNTFSGSSSSINPQVSDVEQETGVISEGNESKIVIENVIAEDNSVVQPVDDTESQDSENQESEPKVPGFEMILAVSGVLMSVYMAKRQQKT
ncbi:hypothetical protein LI82_10350 [Methanococcoides methylutens]|uniref:PGF-CTERM archaeal protein-sorting signal domain-containing protein n=1 Tax=Methanococcoides methylutens TaxID=2226 RepID=A0A099SZ14_METMT|nr:PGF-CTERM sorting domain-containing protein [Methanococcoides methylutens]KGK98120.1 hypothetical protein LI82_10350 [Methanococcoides methylutens]